MYNTVVYNMAKNGNNNGDINANEWVMLDDKLVDKMTEVIEKMDCNGRVNDTLREEIQDIKKDVNNLNKELQDVKSIFQDWKEHLESSRRERLNVLEEIRGFLKENRELYMREFIDEANKLHQIAENGKKLETKLSPQYQLRRDNRRWREFKIVDYKGVNNVIT